MSEKFLEWDDKPCTNTRHHYPNTKYKPVLLVLASVEEKHVSTEYEDITSLLLVVMFSNLINFLCIHTHDCRSVYRYIGIS